jgi:hypothetical protein
MIVKEMVASDLQLAKREKLLKEQGYNAQMAGGVIVNE